MGSHSLEAKRNKRRKRKQRQCQCQVQHASLHDHAVSRQLTSASECEESGPSEYQDFWDALDRIGDEFWSKYQEPMGSFKDVHPAIVCDSKNRFM